MHLADLYYRGELPKGECAPDECIELTLWEKFGWGPEQTERLTTAKLRRIFGVMEQRRVSHDKIENLGRPTQAKAEAIARAMARQASSGGLKVGKIIDDQNMA